MAKELTRKEKQITELYLETTLEVGKNADNWISFLKRASFNYKYRFDEQILIYAQRPDAVACAETTIWNKKLKRWINKGSKGIALITERDGELGLRFVFDVSDTNSDVYGRKFTLWQAEEKYNNDIIEALEDKFGTMEDKSSLSLAIISTVYNRIMDNMQDYLEDLKTVTANSELEKLNNEQIESAFLEILIYSTIGLTMSRCGLDVNDYIPKEYFSGIEKFNTFETMSILGTATRDFSKEILLEISKTVINVQKQEKKKNHTFEKIKQNFYNKENEKGSVENESNLHNERKLSNTRLNDRENKQESEFRQVRQNEISIPKTEQERNLHNASSDKPINRTFDSNARNSDKENSTNSGTNEKEVWNNRRNESEQSNGMGRTDEQYSSNSRANSSEGTNLQLEENDNRILAEKLDKFFMDNDIFDTEDDDRTDEQRIQDIEDTLKSTGEILNTIRYLEEVKKAEDDDIEFNNDIDYYINELKQVYDKLEKEVDNTSFFDDYKFVVGDSIFIGLQEFIISNIDNETITMYDNQFPLDQRTVVIKDIIEKIAENPMNDYLKDRKLPETKEKQESAFNKWLDTFIEEKGIDLQQVIEIKTENNTHYFELGNVIDNIKTTTPEEQADIKDMIVKIDFHNADVVDYFKHLAQALAENYEKQQEQSKEEKQKEQPIEETKEQEVVAEKLIKKNINRNIEYFDLHPEIPTEERNNFKITNDNLGVGTAKEKYRNNVEAIKVLKLCEEQNRYATPEEQEILSKYVGWGGLKSAFEEQNDNWSSEYAELKEILTEDEYKNARQSSLTAYYTPPVVIRNIYKALQNMGLKQANILEPSCRSWQLFRNATRGTRKLQNVWSRSRQYFWKNSTTIISKIDYCCAGI